MLCVICEQRKAEVPDRYGNPNRKRICSLCHRDRLVEDLKLVARVNRIEQFDRKDEGR
jgi:hypothetical protein